MRRSFLLDALLIVVMQFVLVPLTTLRTIFLVKAEIRNASLLGGVEALIYVISFRNNILGSIELFEYVCLCNWLFGWNNIGWIY